MKIITTIYQGQELEWRIKVDNYQQPKKPGAKPIDTENQPTMRFWSPDGTVENRMLLFNPRIALVIRNKWDRDIPSVLIPITLLYALANKMLVIYEGLSTKGLYHRDGNHIYMDANMASAISQKLSVYRSSIVFTPIGIPSRSGGPDIIGVQFIYDGKVIGLLAHTDLREIIEILNHLDIQTYIAILGLMEKLDTMDCKIDRLIEGQDEIVKLLKASAITQR